MVELLTIHLKCEHLPGASFCDPFGRPMQVSLAIQKGKEPEATVLANMKEVTFVAEVRVKDQPEGSLDFAGPYIHGKLGERFIYLTWGDTTHGRFEMFRRAKIQLNQVPDAKVRKHLKSGRPIVAELRLTDAKGGPLCATVKPPYIRWK